MISKIAVDFNNLGVGLLELGDCHGAMVLFKAASQLFTILVASHEHQINSDINFYDQETLHHALQDSRIRAAHGLYLQYLEEDENGQHRLNLFGDSNDDEMHLMTDDNVLGSHKSFICVKAMRISETLVARSGIATTHDGSTSNYYDPHCIAIICSAILYNMGLMYHVAATDSIMETSGQKALNLYDMALTLLMDTSTATVMNESIFTIRLRMFILNNMASLTHELTQYNMSLACRTELNSIVSHLLRAHDGGSGGGAAAGSGRGNSSLRKECQCFMLNALALGLPTQAPAA